MNRPKIPSKTINGIFYHGTSLPVDDGPFSEFKFSGDWEGIWFSDEKDISIKFGERWISEDRSLFIYEVKIKTARIANISFNLWEELKEYYCMEDMRELIPILRNLGFKGWQTIGSIDYSPYNDYCIFYTDIPKILKTEKLTLLTSIE